MHIVIHNLLLVSQWITIMQCPLCLTSMATCHEDRIIHYYRCKMVSCFGIGVQCKFCDYFKLSKKTCFRNIKYTIGKHHDQQHLSQNHQITPFLSSNESGMATDNTTCSNTTGNLAQHSISSISGSIASTQTRSTRCDTSFVGAANARNYQYYHFDYFDSPKNRSFFFLNMVHPPHGGARGMAWIAINGCANPCWNVCQLDETQFVFKSFALLPTIASQHRVNLMDLLQVTVNRSNVNNNVIARFPLHQQDIYRMCMGGKYSL